MSRAGKFLWAADQNSQQTNVPFKWGRFSRDAATARTQPLCLERPSHPPLPLGPETGVDECGWWCSCLEENFSHRIAFLSEEDPGFVRSPEGFAVDVARTPGCSVESVHSQQRGFWIPSAFERSRLRPHSTVNYSGGQPAISHFCTTGWSEKQGNQVSRSLLPVPQGAVGAVGLACPMSSPTWCGPHWCECERAVLGAVARSALSVRVSSPVRSSGQRWDCAERGQLAPQQSRCGSAIPVPQVGPGPSKSLSSLPRAPCFPAWSL